PLRPAQFARDLKSGNSTSLDGFDPAVVPLTSQSIDKIFATVALLPRRSEVVGHCGRIKLDSPRAQWAAKFEQILRLRAKLQLRPSFFSSRGAPRLRSRCLIFFPSRPGLNCFQRCSEMKR